MWIILLHEMIHIVSPTGGTDWRSSRSLLNLVFFCKFVRIVQELVLADYDEGSLLIENVVHDWSLCVKFFDVAIEVNFVVYEAVVVLHFLQVDWHANGVVEYKARRLQSAPYQYSRKLAVETR